MIQSSLLSSVAGIRHRFEMRGAPPPGDLMRLKQIHSASVFTLDAPDSELSGDGILTRSLRPVGIQTADCLPVLMTDFTGRGVAAVHAGWKGLQAGILIEALERFQAEGVRPQDLLIAIGPSIKACCFEVGEEVHRAFGHKGASSQPPTQWGEKSLQPKPSGKGGYWLDLPAIARQQLTHRGVPEIQIEVIPICTYCDSQPDQWASFRRATHQNRAQDAGRQWSWIQRAP